MQHSLHRSTTNKVITVNQHSHDTLKNGMRSRTTKRWTKSSWPCNESMDSNPKWIFKADLSSGIECIVPPEVKGFRNDVKALVDVPLVL